MTNFIFFINNNENKIPILQIKNIDVFIALFNIDIKINLRILGIFIITKFHCNAIYSLKLTKNILYNHLNYLNI